jgi:hypothetical protein
MTICVYPLFALILCSSDIAEAMELSPNLSIPSNTASHSYNPPLSTTTLSQVPSSNCYLIKNEPEWKDESRPVKRKLGESQELYKTQIQSYPQS